MSLQANLNDSSHWCEHHQVPKPSGYQVRMLPSPQDYRGRHTYEEYNRAGPLPDWHLILSVRVESCQPDRPKHLPYISNAAYEDVADSPRERHGFHGSK